MREAERNALESNRITDNKMYKLTILRVNSSASLTSGESCGELEY